MQIKTTANVAYDGIKVLGYGVAGAGKTMLCATAPNPLIISAESGLLTLKNYNLPYIEITSANDLMQAYNYIISSQEGQQFTTICLDSISEIAEVLLSEEKQKCGKDKRQAYFKVQETMTGVLRAFRDIRGRHVYFAAKEETIKDEATGIICSKPMMPGSKLSNHLPFYFDEVFRVTRALNEQRQIVHFIQTKGDGTFEAKDRSGKLDPTEPCDLNHIFNKILS